MENSGSFYRLDLISKFTLIYPTLMFLDLIARYSHVFVNYTAEILVLSVLVGFILLSLIQSKSYFVIINLIK